LPNEKEIKDFEIFLEKYKSFDPSKLWFIANLEKCKMCIYRELCDSSLV
jgi:hypothetical protein